MQNIVKTKEFSIFIILVALCIVLSIISPVFLTFVNFMDILKGSVVIGILAIGMTLIIITGGIDVSVAAITTAISVIVGHLLVMLPDFGGSILFIFLLAPVIGIIFGLVNGFLVAKIKIPAIVATLGTLSIFSGSVLYITNGNYMNSASLPDTFIAFANYKLFGISILVYIFAAVLIGTWLILKYTFIGRSVYAMGGNAQSSTRVGIKNNRVIWFVFGYMGFLAGIAAICQIAYTKAVDPNALDGVELSVIAAVVLGGANLMGGRGTVWGSLLGTLLLAVIQNGLILAHINTFWQKVVVGAIVLIAVSYDQIQQRRHQNKVNAIEVEA